MATGQTPSGNLLPPIPQGLSMPFWYGSLQSFWLYYRVDPEVLRQRLPQLPGGEALHVAMFDFDGEHAGLASVDLQIYTGHGPAYLEAVHEVEFNFYVYPQARVPEVPAMSWRDYVTGQDQTKTIGGFRLHVPCDNPGAVAAGIALFGEPKFLAHFDYTVPGLNAPGVDTWSYKVLQDASGQPGPLIYGITADFRGLAPFPSDPSPLLEYGILADHGVRRLVANEWSFYGPFDTYYLGGDAAQRIQLTYGDATDPTGTLEDLQLLLGNSAPIAAQIFASAPVSAENRGWYLVPK